MTAQISVHPRVISGEPSEHVMPLVYRRWTCTEPDTIFQVKLTTEIK